MAKGKWGLVGGDSRREDYMRRKPREADLEIDFGPIFKKKIYFE